MTTHEIFKRMLDWVYTNQLASNQTEVSRKAGISEAAMWLRGESDVMLLADLTHGITTSVTGMDVSVQVHAELTSQILAAKDEIVNILRSHLADKDAIIELKDRYIKTLQQQLSDLRNLIRLQDDASPSTKQS